MTKEQIESLTRAIYGCNSIDGNSKITEWFKLNPIKPVAVGLTDEQVHEFLDVWYKSNKYNCIEVYKEWAKTQTFAMPVVKDVFQPDWSEFPNFVKKVYLEWTFYDDDEISWSRNVIDEAFERPEPPKPKIEVGQVWRHKETGFSFEVNGYQKVADCYAVCAYHKTKDLSLQMNWEGSDFYFLDKFELVGNKK